MVLSGEKFVTWRIFDDKNLSTGDDLVFINIDTDEEFGTAIILEVREKSLKDINSDDYFGHEKFESHEAMFQTYVNYYGDKVTPETIVKIIRFSFDSF